MRADRMTIGLVICLIVPLLTALLILISLK